MCFVILAYVQYKLSIFCNGRAINYIVKFRLIKRKKLLFSFFLYYYKECRKQYAIIIGISLTIPLTKAGTINRIID